MSDSKIELNVLPLNLNSDKLRCSFFKKPLEGLQVWPLNDYEMPAEVASLQSEVVYTDFTRRKEADMTLTIKLDESPRFAKHYLNYLIYTWFEHRARLRNRDFVNNCELYFVKELNKQQELTVFDRYKLRGTWGRLTGGPELTVMYSGTTKLWNHSILQYDGPTRDFGRVVYNGHLYHYDSLMEQRRVDRRQVFPVINRDIARGLKLARPPWKNINKVKRHTRMIDAFHKKWIQDEAFQEKFHPASGGYMTVAEHDIHRLDNAAANLLFGNGVTGKDPYTGIKEGGPYEAPRSSHIELFFIVEERDAKQVGNRLYGYLKKGIGHFPGLKAFTRVPVYVSKKNITFTDGEDPLPEIKQKLRTTNFKEGVRYGAIYISPIDKGEKDPQKHRVYYRIKEELLKYQITSQVIDRMSVLNTSFAYFLPNIAVALLAKLDGTPWTLVQKQKKELVIGVGAFSPSRFRKTYLGSAFCFSNDGSFHGFESFTAGDSLKLAGSFQKAVKQFKEENDDVERVVIHFYKRMSKKEAGIIMGALRELKLKVPLVILTIHKTGSSDLVLTDRSKSHRLPLSGTYYRSGKRQFLLCNNARFDEGEKLRGYPYPIKVYIDVRGPDGELVEEQLDDKTWVHELLEQVYQFSRLNWKTVSTRSMPVTVLYPQMVAEKFPFFEGNRIPGFGKRNLWFL